MGQAPSHPSFQSLIKIPPRTFLRVTFCFSFQLSSIAISLGRVTARLVFPMRVIFLVFLSLSLVVAI